VPKRERINRKTGRREAQREICFYCWIERLPTQASIRAQQKINKISLWASRLPAFLLILSLSVVGQSLLVRRIEAIELAKKAGPREASACAARDLFGLGLGARDDARVDRHELAAT
jgi:hypothetical protein